MMKSASLTLLFVFVICRAMPAAEDPAPGNMHIRKAAGAQEGVHAPVNAAEDEPKRAREVAAVLQGAIAAADRLGADGDLANGVQTYENAARALLAGASLREYHRHELARLQGGTALDPKERIRLLRQGFKDMLSDLSYTFAVEDAFPEGFPAPGLVGLVLTKEYPACRAARASEENPFMTLYRFIDQNAIGMTAPVAMTVDHQLQVKDMAFFFEQPTLGQVGQDGEVAVVDLPALKVMSVGMRGARSDDRIARAKAVLAASSAAQGVATMGDYRILGYHGPHVPLSEQYWELQIQVVSP